MRALHAIPLLLLPLVAHAGRDCPHQAPRNLDLDLTGVDSLVIEIGHHELALTGTAEQRGTVTGRACASSAARLDQLQLEQERDGGRLLLRAAGTVQSGMFDWLFGGSKGDLQLNVEIPHGLPVQLKVGSGDARIERLATLDLSIGSGDVEARQLDALQVRVGSGDLVAREIGRLRIDALGSGDVTVDAILGDATVGSVGSGDLVLREVAGRVEIGSIGSGDVTLQSVAGSVEVQSLGSGDLVARQIGGDLSLARKGSGDVRHSGVEGKVSVPNKR
jgi:hypothetical protein